MIYLAESGSTKCDAVFLTEGGEELRKIRTIGFNPYFHNRDFVAKEIVKVPDVAKLGSAVTQVYFYGAGCSTKALQAEIAAGLKAGFPHAKIHVGHDLQAAAYATWQGEAQITCILGTGSNVVYYDGQQTHPGRSGYGFIVGDEGSASYIGKRIVRAYLYHQMEEELRQELEKDYQISESLIRDKVYAPSGANVFLGNLSPFAFKHIQNPFFYQMVFNGFKEFLETQVLPFPQSTKVPISFVGSIAYHFEAVLRDALDFFEFKMGVIVRRPVEGLMDYHRRQMLKTQKN